MEIKGLTTAQAVDSRLKNGDNKLSEREVPSLSKKYWEKFNDPIIIVLLVALGINIIFTLLGKADWFECAGIFVSVMIATWVSALSEYKNEKSFREIQAEASNTLCKVYRDGSLCEILTDNIVKGDFVLLQSGDIVPADGLIIEGTVFVDQSALNGESKEIQKSKGTSHAKTIDFWDKHTLYRSSVITSGQCIMEITTTGDNTVCGQLNSHNNSQSLRPGPLQVKLTELAKGISRFGYIGAVLVVAAYLCQRILADNCWNVINISQYLLDTSQVISDIVSAIILGVTVVVVSVPEGLPLMIAIVCSLNMKKMMKSKVLVRKLIGIETAGSLNILFTDKTGTLTCGKLNVVNFIDGTGNTYLAISQIPLSLRQITQISVLGNTGTDMSGGKAVGGNTTEKALSEFIYKDNHPSVNIRKLRENLFSSDKKFSQCEVSGDFSGVLIKGAPELILKNCNRCYDSQGREVALDKIRLTAQIRGLAENSIRVLALATAKNFTDGTIPANMTLVGLAAIRDELRPNVKGAVSQVKGAGIQTVMITGDKKETALAIAKEAGIWDGNENIALDSSEIQKMSDLEIAKILPRLRIVARALPTDKSRLVQVAQGLGFVVGMTGDGINDLAALRCADVGFAMGSGTPVAKNSGDIVVLDDNFSSIRSAILYGRTIYKSIKKFVTCQMTINISAVLVSVLGPLLGMEKPLAITQMLWINLIMDTLAAIAFGGEPSLNRYMLDTPKQRTEKILDKKAWFGIVINSLFVCVVSLIFFSFREAFQTPEVFCTIYFNFFVFAGVINAINARCEGVNLLDHLSLNKPFMLIIGLICVVQIFITYFGGQLLRTVALTPVQWLVAILPALLIIPVDLLRKIIINKNFS